MFAVQQPLLIEWKDEPHWENISTKHTDIYVYPNHVKKFLKTE